MLCSATTLHALGIISVFLIVTTGQLDLAIILQVYRDVRSIFLWVLRLNVFSPDRLTELFLSLLLLFPTLVLDFLSHLVSPGDEARLEEHLGEEQVDGHGLVLVKEGLLARRPRDLATKALLLQNDLSDLELRHKLRNGHNLVELEFACGDILSAHDAIEHLVEVDESIIDIDAHLQNDPVKVLGLRILDTQFTLHVLRKFVNEILQLVCFKLRALVALCQIFPAILEIGKVILEPHQW